MSAPPIEPVPPKIGIAAALAIDDSQVASSAELIAGMARSLRGTLLRDRRPGDPVTYADLADAVEIVQLLASEVQDLAKRVAK